MSHIKKIIGKKINCISLCESKIYKLETSDKQNVNEIILSIEEYTLTIINKIGLDTELEAINELTGAYIEEVLENSEYVKIITADKKWLLIDLRDEAYFCPEAMILTGPDNLCIVWN